VPVLSNFVVPSQKKAGNLCWACVGVGVASFYDQLSNAPPRWTQLCQFVMDVFGEHDGTPPEELRCCQDDRLNGPDCNQPFWLPDALGVAKNQGSFLDRPMDYADVKTQIDLLRPIGVEVETSFGNHVVAIFGYDDSDGQKLVVGDPAPDAPGNALMKYDDLLNDYRHAGGRWIQSYLTVPTRT
jgi:hypothetical protein